MNKKKKIEQPLIPEVKERKLRIPSLGSRSVVTGEEYIDPNEEGWKLYFQREEEKKAKKEKT